MARIQGIDIEKNAEKPVSSSMMERVRERLGKAKQDGRPENDITRLRGRKAKELQFGIGMGLDYEVIDADGSVTAHK